MPIEPAPPRRLGWWASPLCAAALLLAACSDAAAPPVDDEPVWDLVFEGRLGTTPELLVWDEEGDSVRKLLSQNMVVMEPRPSPDGTRIAFVVANYVDGTGDIYVMDRDGKNVKQLTFAPELDHEPAWSPDGQLIAFTSYRTQALGDIWVMTASGQNPVHLTPDPLPAVIDETHPSWSPDGTRIVYVSNEAGGKDIWTMNPQGGDRLRITDTEDIDDDPVYSPDGATIAFRRLYATSGSADIHLVPAEGGTAVPITLPGNQRMPAWWPDGQGLVVVTHETTDGRRDLYSVRLDGSDLRPLVTDAVAGGSVHPAFLLRR